MKTNIDRRTFIAATSASAVAASAKEQTMTGKVTIRKADERGRADHGWLKSNHTFSFANYYDPQHMGYRSLRVINDDEVRAGEGFGTHPHRDMEIISYVVDGALEHKDSMGNGSIIRPNDVQRLSAGSGITHSEFNPQKDTPVHFLQIWIQPDKKGVEPSYEQKAYTVAEKTNRLRLVASPDGADGSVTIHQDARVYASILEPNAQVTQPVAADRHIWVQVVRGQLTLNGETLRSGDGASVEHSEVLEFAGLEPSEFLVFDLA